jgi:hypothetical protein
MATGSRARLIALAIPFAVGDEPPTEFRIFKAGPNTTTKGTFLFDEIAAKSVIDDYTAHGIDAMIDLEHLSLADADQSRNFDPDARGWAKLELRAGELWAVNVAWTPDGAQRLREKRQRYISPAFDADPETHRITRILNIAITALPATDNLKPLVAASTRLALTSEGDSPMTTEQFAQLAEALDLGSDASVEDVLATVAAMVKKITDAANGAPADGGGDAAAASAAANDAPKEGEPMPMVAAKRLSIAARTLSRLAGKPDIAAAIAEVEAWRASHLELESTRVALAQDRAALENGERRKLVGELVKLGAETPATAWQNDDGKTPVKRLADEPIAELRARVQKLSAARGGRVGTVTDPKPPSSSGELTAEQLRICTETGCKPEVFAALRKSNPVLTVRS